MFIAPDFVFVHLSKTGGTFVEETLREVFCPSVFGQKVHRLKTRHGITLPFWKYRFDEVGDQHGICNEIPTNEKHKTIVSCIRNPFDLYVSEYTFNWWKKYAGLWFHDLATIETLYPEWQTFSFEEFIDVSNLHTEWVHKALSKYPQTARLGWYSHKFIHYYCRDHDYVFEAADDLSLLVERVKESVHQVQFLHTDRLNGDLVRFLLSQGYPQERIEFISKREKINTSRSDHEYRTRYTPELRRKIEEKDALIFRLFPEFDF